VARPPNVWGVALVNNTSVSTAVTVESRRTVFTLAFPRSDVAPPLCPASCYGV
jgi:hypothetical protein